MLSIIRSFHAIVAILALTCGLGFFGASAPSALADEAAADLYYKIPGTPSGPAAPSPTETVYSRMGSYDSRLAVWFVTQQHTYFGGFVLALPLFCALLEFLGLLKNKPGLSLRYSALRGISRKSLCLRSR
jgi:cytochrome d ubiquinol oxidase subunit I